MTKDGTGAPRGRVQSFALVDSSCGSAHNGLTQPRRSAVLRPVRLALVLAALAAFLALPGAVSGGPAAHFKTRCCFRITVDTSGGFYVTFPKVKPDPACGCMLGGVQGEYRVFWSWGVRSLEEFLFRPGEAHFQALGVYNVGNGDYSTACCARYAADFLEDSSDVEDCDTKGNCSHDDFRVFCEGREDFAKNVAFVVWDNKGASNKLNDGYDVKVPAGWRHSCNPGDFVYKDGFFTSNGQYWRRTVSSPPLAELERPGAPPFDKATTCYWKLFKTDPDHTSKAYMLTVVHVTSFPAKQLPMWKARLKKLAGENWSDNISREFSRLLDAAGYDVTHNPTEPFPTGSAKSGCHKPVS